MDDFKVGSIIKCQVTGIEKYGIFVSVNTWYNGLVHISEISNGYVKNIEDFVKVGELIYCQILDIDETNSRLKLSIKNINYKSTVNEHQIQESRLGFLPLKNALPKWIDEGLKMYNRK